MQGLEQVWTPLVLQLVVPSMQEKTPMESLDQWTWFIGIC